MKWAAFLLAPCLSALAALPACADDDIAPPAPPPFVPVHVQIGPDGVERPAGQDEEKPAAAAQPPAPDNLFRTWLDLRPALEHAGITPSLTYTSDLVGNPAGGQRQGFAECDQIVLSLDCNLERICGLTGAKALVSFYSCSGSSLTDSYLNNVFEVQQVYGGETWHLTNLAFEQALEHDQFNIRVGRQAAGDEFQTAPLAGMFMQNAVSGHPVGILYNAPGMTSAPIASWGARFAYKPEEELTVKTGLFDGNPNVAENSMNGLDFTLRGPLFWINEVCYSPNTRKGATGLPGHYKAGIWYNGGTFPQFTPFSGLAPNLPDALLDDVSRLRLDRYFPELTSRNSWGDWGFYAMMDQILWQRGRDAKQSIGIYAALMVAPDQRINQMPYFADTGIVLNGLAPGRPLDAAGFQVMGGAISYVLHRAQQIEQLVLADPQIPAQAYEMALEWVYSIHVARGIQLEPDVQYIINPGAAGEYSNAIVLGLQVSITF